MEKDKSLDPNPERSNIFGRSTEKRSHNDGLRGRETLWGCGTPEGKGSWYFQEERAVEENQKDSDPKDLLDLT